MRVYERPDKEADALTQEVCKQAWVSGEPLSWGLQIGRSVFVFVLGKGVLCIGEMKPYLTEETA